MMKILHLIAAVLLVIGGLNWGLVGFFHFNFVEMVFGTMPALMRLIYCLVGLSAVYFIFQWKPSKKRSKSK